MARFIQLTPEDVTYLLELIEDMDSDTQYTEKQRGYTVPKLHRILNDPCSQKLAFQDVDYLLELIEDDDLPETEQQKELTRTNLLHIQTLQNQKFDETRSIENQRNARKIKRSKTEVLELQKHFARTSPGEN